MELNTATQDAHDAQATAERLRAISDEVSDRFYERAGVVRTLLHAAADLFRVI